VRHLDTDEDARAFGRQFAARGLEFVGNVGGAYATTGEEWATKRAHLVHQLRMNHLAGAKIV